MTVHHVVAVSIFLLLPRLAVPEDVAVTTTTTNVKQEVVEPEFAGVFYNLHNGTLVALERQVNTTNHVSVGAGALIPFHGANAKSVSVFPEKTSPVRFQSGPLDFIVRTEIDPAHIDPNLLYSLRRLDQKKNRRETTVITVHASSLPFGGITSKTNQAALPIDFSRYGTASLRLHTEGLPPGEYAIVAAPPTSTSLFFFCFGVD